MAFHDYGEKPEGIRKFLYPSDQDSFVFILYIWRKGNE